MNSTSPVARLVNTAARSPERSLAGPLVMRRPVPSSAATIMESVVLPSPREPDRRMWSGGGPRRTAPREYQPLRALLTDARYRDQRRGVPAGDGLAHRVRTQHGEYRLGQPRPHTTGGLQQLEQVFLVVVGEPVEGQRVLAHHQRGG